LYFFSGTASDDFRIFDAVGGRTDMLATGIAAFAGVVDAMLVLLHRSIVEIVWLASVGVRFKVCLDYFGI
jgi:hypothetical protein